MRHYKCLVGQFKGQIGIMIGRVADCSNNDIRLEFNCGTKRWYNFRDVELTEV
jgi:hypothetical protein